MVESGGSAATAVDAEATAVAGRRFDLRIEPASACGGGCIQRHSVSDRLGRLGLVGLSRLVGWWQRREEEEALLLVSDRWRQGWAAAQTQNVRGGNGRCPRQPGPALQPAAGPTAADQPETGRHAVPCCCRWRRCVFAAAAGGSAGADVRPAGRNGRGVQPAAPGHQTSTSEPLGRAAVLCVAAEGQLVGGRGLVCRGKRTVCCSYRPVFGRQPALLGFLPTRPPAKRTAN